MAVLLTAVTVSASRADGQPGAAPVTAVDVDGRALTLLAPASPQLDLLLFVATDCPISNRYAPEIARICSDYQGRGLRCVLVYPDAALAPAAVATHRHEYGLSNTGPAVIDRDHALVRAAGPRVTPEAALYSSSGRIYRGRIDDLYLDVGRSRRQASQHDLRIRIEAALAGRTIAPAETEAVGCFIPNP